MVRPVDFVSHLILRLSIAASLPHLRHIPFRLTTGAATRRRVPWVEQSGRGAQRRVRDFLRRTFSFKRSLLLSEPLKPHLLDAVGNQRAHRGKNHFLIIICLLYGSPTKWWIPHRLTRSASRSAQWPVEHMVILQGANDAARDRLEMFEIKMRRWLNNLKVRCFLDDVSLAEGRVPR